MKTLFLYVEIDLAYLIGFLSKIPSLQHERK